jgi:hypothetical protein
VMSQGRAPSISMSAVRKSCSTASLAVAIETESQQADQADAHENLGSPLDGVQRFDAHRFYLKKRMIISSYHFSLEL